MYSHFSHSHAVTLFGVLFLAAIATNWWLARRNAAQIGIEPSHVDLLLPLAILGGIAGATVLALLPPEDNQLAGPLLGVDIRLRLFGIVMSGAIVLFIYSRVTGLAFRSLLDTFALPTIAAIAVHRVGCFFAGCCWGDVSVVISGLEETVTAQIQTLPWLAGDWVAWAVTYEPGTWPYNQQLAAGLIGADAAESLPVHPVQLYEVALLVLAYAVVNRITLSETQPGIVAAAATLAYCTLRFPLEFVRADGALLGGNLTLVQLQIIALVLLTAIAIPVFSRFPDSPTATAKISHAR